MSHSIGTTCVCEATNGNVITVSPTDKIEIVARLFDEQEINAAPVVDGFGKCIGVITSHDVVRFEADRNVVEQQCKGGFAFDLKDRDGSTRGLVGRPFDEVAYHMSRDFESIGGLEPLSRAARLMCNKHLHHVITLDDAGRPLGILSSLDILGQILGVPVLRTKRAK